MIDISLLGRLPHAARIYFIRIKRTHKMVIFFMLLFFGCFAIGFMALTGGGNAFQQISAIMFWILAALFLIGATITDAINRLRKAIVSEKSDKTPT